MRLPLLVCALWTVACAHHFFAEPVECKYKQNQPPAEFNEPYRRLCLEDWALNRTYVAAMDAPIARELQTRPNIVHTLSTLLNFVEGEYERSALMQRQERSFFVRFPEEPCNLMSKAFETRMDSVNVSLSRYGWGLMESRCATGLISAVNETVLEAMKQYEIDISSVMNVATRGLPQEFKFRSPSTFSKFNYKTSLDTCKMWHYAAFRYKGQWGINTPITNDLLTRSLPEWHRHYFVEVLRLGNNNRIEPIRMTLRERPKFYDEEVGFNTTWVQNASTHIATWGGIPASSLFESLQFLAENPAISAALDDVAATIDQVEDATTPSGMAILIIPLFLTTIPLALFTEMDTKALLLYTIVTDILTVLPLAIKGIELLNYSGMSHEAARTYVYGGSNPVEPAALETWYASCDANDHVKILGKLFIAMAVLFMVVGIALEIGAKRFFDKRKAEFEFVYKSRGFGKEKSGSTKHRWGRGASCRECECPAGTKWV